MDQNELKPHIRSLKNSDKAAFRIIFNALQQSIFNFLLFKTDDKALAEDLLQDTFVKLWEKRKTLKEEESLKAWLYKVAGNLYLNHLRHAGVVMKHREETVFQNISVDKAHPQFLLEEQEFNNLLVRTMGKLPERIKEIFLMSRTEALSNKEIAERLGLSIKTIESHLGKALKILCSTLPKKYFMKNKERRSG